MQGYQGRGTGRVQRKARALEVKEPRDSVGKKGLTVSGGLVQPERWWVSLAQVTASLCKEVYIRKVIHIVRAETEVIMCECRHVAAHG